MIDKLAMFSENETLEDLVTSEIRYISTSFFLGQLLQQKLSGSRIENLNRASQSYREFLSICKSYAIILPLDLPTVISILDGGERSAERSTGQADVRQQRIQRYKRDKELEASIASLAGNPRMDEDDIRSLSLMSISLEVSKAVEEIKFIEKELSILQSQPERSAHDKDAQRRHQPEDPNTWRLDRQSTILGPGGKVCTVFGRTKRSILNVYRC